MVSFSVIVTRCVTVTEPVASAAPFARSTVSVGVALVVLVVAVLSIGMTTSVSRVDIDDDDDEDKDFEFVVVVVVGRGNVVRVIGGTVKLLLGRCLKKGSRWVVVGSSVTGGNTVG